MIYLASRLHLSYSITSEQIFEEWKQLAQEIERSYWSTSIWKVWQTTQILAEDISRTRVYSMNGQPHPLKTVGIAYPCYLRFEQGDYGSMFTMLSREKAALESVTSLIENIYAPVIAASLEEFLQQNQTLPVQAARLYEPDRDRETILTFGQPVALSELLDREPSLELLSLSTSVNNIVAPPLNVRMLYVSKADHQVGFSVETDLQKEDVVIDELFTLADRTFKGEWRLMAS